MRKIFFLVLILMLISFWSCGGKRSAPSPKVKSPVPRPSAQTPSVSPELLKFNNWASQLRDELGKRGGGNINNIALPGEKLGERVVIMTTNFSKVGREKLAQGVAQDFKKKFPGKPTVIEIYDNGKLVLKKEISSGQK